MSSKQVEQHTGRREGVQLEPRADKRWRVSPWQRSSCWSHMAWVSLVTNAKRLEAAFPQCFRCQWQRHEWSSAGPSLDGRKTPSEQDGSSGAARREDERTSLWWATLWYESISHGRNILHFQWCFSSCVLYLQNSECLILLSSPWPCAYSLLPACTASLSATTAPGEDGMSHYYDTC